MAAAVTAVPFVAALPATAPTAAAAEVDYFGPQPTTVLTMAIYPGGNDDDLRGVVCEGQRTCVAVPFPYLERGVGAEDLETALVADTSGLPHIVFGYSQGARVVANWLEEYAGAEDAPSPEQLSFVLIGNPGRKHGGAHVIWDQVTPDTQYDVLDVARQYDLTADRPDHWSPLARANAYAGLAQLHGHYEDVDIYAPTNYVWKENNTTYVFVPTDDLPLLTPLRRLGLNDLADALNDPLKERIEKAYDRSYLPAQPGWPADLEPTEPPANLAPAESGPASQSFARTAQTSAPRKSITHKQSGDDHRARLHPGNHGRPAAHSDSGDDAAADPAHDAADKQGSDTSSGQDSSNGAGSSGSASSSESGNSSGGDE